MAEISYFNVNTDGLYSDGAEVERDILKYVQEYPEEEYYRILEKDQRWPVFYHLSDMRENILNWYDFSPDCDVLEIGGGMGALTGLLCRRAKTVTTVELTNNRAQVIYARHREQDNLKIIVGNFNDIVFRQKYDYITLIGVLEYAPGFTPGGDPADFLKKVRGLLKPGGKLLIAIENRFGLKYWCGANEDHTGKPYDGINGYPNTNQVHTYSRSELIELLESSGFENHQFFYPLPDYKLPQVVYSDEYLPKHQILAKIRQYYLDNPSILADEGKIYDDIVKNEVFPFFANSFFVECGEQEAEMSTAEFVSFTPERAPEYKVYTVIYRDSCVKKYAATPQAQKHINNIIEKQKQYTGNDLAPYHMQDHFLVMPYYDIQTLDIVISNCIRQNDIVQLMQWIKLYYEHIRKSSLILQSGETLVFRTGFLDMTFSNCFLRDSELIFFDQEWTEENTPVDFILFRAFTVLYSENPDLENCIPITNIWKILKINEPTLQKYWTKEREFLKKICPSATNSLQFLDRHSGRVDLNALDRISPKMYFATVYFDLGHGYCEDNSIRINYTPNQPIRARISVPSNTIGLRFDPVENSFCAIRHLDAVSDVGILTFNSVNGESKDGLYWFMTTDPQIEVNITTSVRWVEFSAEILLLDSMVGVYVLNCLQSALHENRARLEELAEAKKANAQYNQCLEEQKNRQSNLEQELAEVKKTNAEYNQHIEEQKDRQSNLEQELAEVKRSYQEISNATFWKITKPFRVVLDTIKTGKPFRGENQPKEDLRPGGKYSHLLSKGLTSLKQYGAVHTIRKVGWYLKRDNIPQTAIQKKESDVLIDIEINDEYQPSQELYQRLKGKPVDIIVPIYNGMNLLPPLLESIPRTKMPYHLFLIDDKSPDQSVLPMLHDYAAKMGNVTVVENQENLGYTRSVNKGLSLAKGHVVLLNSDVRLPMYWLERLMTPILMDSRVASVTPFTNSGTICSFPRFLENNDLYLGLSVDKIDTAFGRLKPQYTVIPTGVGFCMALSRGALTVVGQYDEESFPRGYGEENDWCQRAEKAGFRNVMAENLFVYHQHGATFTPEEKQKLIQIHSLRLNQKHPNYDADVQSYIKLDPAKKYRETVQLLLFRQDAEETSILAFSHAWGGGSAYYLEEKIEALTKAGRDFLTIQYFDGRGYQLSRFFNGYSFSVSRNHLEQLFPFLPERLGEVWVNELVSYPEIEQVLQQIKALSQKRSAKLIFRLHDFYCICPSITLLNHKAKFCGVPSPEGCLERCRKHRNTDHWRAIWGSFLKDCNEITAFSCDSASLLKRAYPELEQVTIVPHTVKSLRPVSPHKKGEILTIGVIGAISEEKGLKILEQMAKIIHHENKPVRIRIIGYTAYDLKYRDVISCTGKYERDKLPEIVEKNKIDLILIPSICPETFSYTTEEGMMMGLPVAVFNIGAPAERVHNYPKGIILTEISAEAALKELYEYWARLNNVDQSL